MGVMNPSVTVSNSPESQCNGIYKLTSEDVDIPEWFKTNPKMNTSDYMKETTGQEQQIHIFGGSNEFSNKINDDTWKAHAKEWYISTQNTNVIFFDLVQKKWHMGGGRPNVSQSFDESWRSAQWH